MKRPEPTVSKLPELVILGGPLPTFQFFAISATIFHANMKTGNIWLRVHGQLWLPMECTVKYTPRFEVILKLLNLSIPSFRMIYCLIKPLIIYSCFWALFVGFKYWHWLSIKCSSMVIKRSGPFVQATIGIQHCSASNYRVLSVGSTVQCMAVQVSSI